MSSTQQVPATVPFNFIVPISKVDVEQRLVTGIATQEVLDKQGDIVDYEAAKKFFLDSALWPGNIREMHGSKAVGKKVSVECNDDEKAIYLTSYISKGAPDTWEKIIDGTLGMYSIGGSGERVTEKLANGTQVNRLLLKALSETSVVDNGACPTASFQIVKSVDGELVDAQPTDDEPAAVLTDGEPVLSDEELAALKATEEPTPDIDKVAKALDALLPVKKEGPESFDIDQAMGAISVLNHLISSEYWDAQLKSAMGEDASIELDQVEMLKAAAGAVLRFLQSEFDAQFDSSTPDETPVMMFVKSLAHIQKAGARHSKADVDLIQKGHDVMKSLGADCAAEKVVVHPIEPTEKVDTVEIQKLTSDLDVTKTQLAAAQATVAAHAETVEKLETRLKVVEGKPDMSKGPVKTAVRGLALPEQPKSDGDITPAQMLQAFDKMTADAKTPEERLALVTKRTAFAQSHNLDRVDFITGRNLS